MTVIKVWDILSGSPSCILDRAMKMGQLHSLDACPDAPFVLAVGGDNPTDNVRVWDVREAADGMY